MFISHTHTHIGLNGFVLNQQLTKWKIS